MFDKISLGDTRQALCTRDSPHRLEHSLMAGACGGGPSERPSRASCGGLVGCPQA